MNLFAWVPRGPGARRKKLVEEQAELWGRRHAHIVQVLIGEYDEAMTVYGCSKRQREGIRIKALSALRDALEPKGQDPITH